MIKSVFHCTLAIVACSLLASITLAAPRSGKSTTPHKTPSQHPAKTTSGKEKLTIDLVGADGIEPAAITKALADSNLQAKLHEAKGKGKPLHLTADIDPAEDLSQFSKAIGNAASKGQPAPVLQIVVYAPITKESGTQALAELEKVKGVDVKHSAADVKTGELHVAITGNDHVTAKDITTAVQSAGVSGHLSKSAKSRTS
jgi:hypothetical protein